MKNNSIYAGVVIIVLIIIGVFAWRSYFGGQNQNQNLSTNVQQNTSTQAVASSTVSLVLQPKQCTTEPWQTWYKEGDIKFVKAPTDEQLIKAYYSQKYGINIISVNRSDIGKITCQACNSCSKNYVFTMEVRSEDVAKLTSLGWMNVGEKQ